jgi:hypothetical protein
MLWRRFVIGYIWFSTFFFFLPASRSLFNDAYQWGNGYFFRTAHGSFKGIEGFLPAFIPFLIGALIFVYGRRGKASTFGMLALFWSTFQLLNLLLMGGPFTFRGDTYQVEWTSTLLSLAFQGWPALSIVGAALLLRKREFGWSLIPITKKGWILIGTALVFSVVIGYLEKSGPMVSVANRFAVLFTIAQYILFTIGLLLGGRSASAPVINRKVEARVGGK